MDCNVEIKREHLDVLLQLATLAEFECEDCPIGLECGASLTGNLCTLAEIAAMKALGKEYK